MAAGDYDEWVNNMTNMRRIFSVQAIEDSETLVLDLMSLIKMHNEFKAEYDIFFGRAS